MNYFTIYNFIKSHLKDVRLYLVGLSLASLSLFMAVRFFPSYFYKVFPPNIYLILHGLAEIFSVIISLLIFTLAWATYQQTQNTRSLFIGVSFLGVAILDTFHLFSFPGMPVLFNETSTQKAIYYWLAARFWAVGALLTGSFLPTRNSFRFLSRPLLLVLTLTMAALVVGIDIWGASYVPAFFLAGEGLTPLKIASERVIMALALVALFVYGQRHAKEQESSLPYLMAGLILTMVSEMSFTFYKSAFDTYNLLGHIYKIGSYSFLLYALFIVEIRQPYLALGKAYKELGESEQRYRTLLENTPIGIVTTTPGGKLMDGNPAVWKMFGYASKEEVSDYPVSIHYSNPEDREHFLERLIRQGNIKDFEVQLKRKDGKLFWGRVTSTLQASANGTVQIINAVEDVTEYKRTQEALEKALKNWQSTFEAISDGIWLLDPEGRILQSNGAFESLFFLKTEDIIGRHCYEIAHRTGGFIKDCPLQRMKQTGVCEVEEFEDKKRGAWFQVAVDPIRDKSGVITGAVHIVRDITERKRLEEQLLQSQKMEAVGTLAGGVAHDFNNLLTAIIGNLELAKFKSKDREVEIKLEEIESIAHRAALLTRQLLAFSRRQLLYPQLLNLNDTVTHMSKMLTRLIGEHIKLDFKLEDKLGMVKADPGQIEQVIMNLCVNARDAMPQGGRLIIETQNTILDESYIEGHPWVKSGDHVMLAVTDTGSGMDEATRARIFEPFFTTKEVGKGTGLGLSMVYGIVKQHQGYINVYSEPDYGTTFKIYLPCCEEKVAAAAKVVEEVPEVLGGQETVLLAEDEDSLREAIQNILQMYGYKVLTAKDGQEAVELYEREKERIDLAILDAVMPKMGGRQVAEFIYRSKPAQKILFSSGYSADGIHEAFIIPGEMHFIQKPYRAKDLAQKVREVLDS